MKQNPTAENMARLLFNVTKKWIEKTYDGVNCGVVRVEVQETETGSAFVHNCFSFDLQDDILVEAYII